MADHVEALEQQAQAIFDGDAPAPNEAAAAPFSGIETVIAPLIDASASREL